jgi:hypothetical protein
MSVHECKSSFVGPEANAFGNYILNSSTEEELQAKLAEIPQGTWTEREIAHFETMARISREFRPRIQIARAMPSAPERA